MLGFFWKVYFWARGLLILDNIRMDLSLVNQLMLSQKLFVSSTKFTILISCSPVCTPLIPVNIIEMDGDLGCSNIQKHWEWTVLQNCLHDEGKGVREETIYFYFQIEYCSAQLTSDRWKCHGNQGMETKFHFLLETSIVSYRNYIISIFLVFQQFDYSYCWI